MLFRRDILQGIAEGRVTLAFRRWRRAPPADGSVLRSPVGVLCLDRVTIVDEGDITPEDVRRTGLSPGALRAFCQAVPACTSVVQPASTHPWQIPTHPAATL